MYFQLRCTMLHTLPIAGLEVSLDRVAREQEVIVAHRSGVKQRLRLFKCGLARGRIVGRQGECTKGERTEKREACLTADPDGFFRVGDRLGPPPGSPVKFRQKCQRLRFKTPRAELLRQCQGGCTSRREIKRSGT